MNGAASAQPIGRKLARGIRRRVKSWTTLLMQPATPKTVSSEKPPATTKAQRWCLLVTLGVDALAAIALAGGQLYLAKTELFSTLGAAILLAIGVANLWAFNSTWQLSPSLPREVVIAQVLTLFLALYIVVIDVIKTPVINRFMLAIAVTVAAVALVWILFLGRRAAIPWTKTGLIVAALFPLAGLLQFWLENYYLPGTSAPQIDISTELSPQTKTKTGSIIHLSAKITIHNRSAARVSVPVALMRVTAYPETTEQPEPSYMCERPSGDQQWCRIEGGVDISGANSGADFRRNAAPAANAQLLYAGLLTNGTSTFMTPGETDILQREVDLDSSKFRLARLSISGLFIPERRIDDVIPCWNYSTASAYTDFRDFSLEVGSPVPRSDQKYVPAIDTRVLQQYLCMNYEIAPNDVIGWLMGNRSVVQVRMILNDPQDPYGEYPDISFIYAVADQKGNPKQVDRRVERMMREDNPVSAYKYVSAEYSPGEPIPPKDKN